MSFQNSYGPDGSININVVPSFGRIVQLPENQKVVTVHDSLCRFPKLMLGEPEREPFAKDQLTSTPADTSHSALGKSSRIPLTNSTFTNMLKDQDSAED